MSCGAPFEPRPSSAAPAPPTRSVVYSVRQRTSADSDRIGGQVGVHMSDHATGQKEK
jgi:hypothetical protein